MLNVICVWAPPANDMSDWFTVDYVHKLYNGVKRNLDIDFQFHVLTDKGEELKDHPYNIIPLANDLEMYWNKIEMFKKDLFTGPCLYLDLDVLVTRNITGVVKNLMDKSGGQFFMIRQFFDSLANSSIMYWNDDFGHIYENFVADIPRNVYMFRRRGIGNIGDQGYIAHMVDYDYLDNFSSIGWVTKNGKRIMTSADHHFVVFMSRDQKPHKMIDDPTVGDIIKKHWV